MCAVHSSSSIRVHYGGHHEVPVNRWLGTCQHINQGVYERCPVRKLVGWNRMLRIFNSSIEVPSDHTSTSENFKSFNLQFFNTAPVYGCAKVKHFIEFVWRQIKDK